MSDSIYAFYPDSTERLVIPPPCTRCVIPPPTWASADRRAAADWVLPGTSTSTWTERRPEASFFTLMMAPWDPISAAEGAPPPPGDARGRQGRIHRDTSKRVS